MAKHIVHHNMHLVAFGVRFDGWPKSMTS